MQNLLVASPALTGLPMGECTAAERRQVSRERRKSVGSISPTFRVNLAVDSSNTSPLPRLLEVVGSYKFLVTDSPFYSDKSEYR